MQATSLIQLNRIAQAGAKKINAYGTAPYTIEATLLPNVYRMTNPEGIAYRVNTENGTCACKFYGENRFNPATKTGFKMGVNTCKHIEYLREQEYWDARATEEAEREETRIEEGITCY